MRRSPDRADRAVYERIIEWYTPYILVRCTRYTNQRGQAQQIGVYALITTCLIVARLERIQRVGRVVDIVMNVVGPDVVSGGRGEVWWRGLPEPLMVEPRMGRVSQALNGLKRPWREVLVLHYVCGREPSELAWWLQKPAGQIVATLARARRLLAGRLEGLGGNDGGARAVDVRSLLAEFAAGLDAGWISEVAQCALDYLSGEAPGCETYEG